MSGVKRLKLSLKERAKKLFSQTITYKKGQVSDPGELAKKISIARKNKQTKVYKDSIDKAYRHFGKKAPKRVDKRKQPPTGSTGIGVGM